MAPRRSRKHMRGGNVNNPDDTEKQEGAAEGVFRDPDSSAEIEALEKGLDNDDLTVVLVHADWCPHCHHYMPIWNKLKKLDGKKATMISVTDTVLPHTSLARAAIDGFPSVVVVEKGGAFREYKVSSGVTNAFPDLHDVNKMKMLLLGKPDGEFLPFEESTSNINKMTGGSKARSTKRKHKSHEFVATQLGGAKRNGIGALWSYLTNKTKRTKPAKHAKTRSRSKTSSKKARRSMK